MQEVAVIIANWNGRKFLGDCLDSLEKQTFKNFRIIFVDNGSTDGSADFVISNYPEIDVIRLEKNTGFARANNIGIQKAFDSKETKFVITLNNDTKADPEYVENLVECAKRHPDAGSIQPKVVNFYDQKIIDSVGILVYKDMSAINRGQKEKDEGQYEKEEEIFGASASAALYFREALEKTRLPENNYFDDDYFAYYEDVDLAWRLRLSGYGSYYCPGAVVFHIHSATGKNYSPFKSFYISRNQYYNIIKDLPFIFMLEALAFMPVRYLMLLASIAKKKGPASKIKENRGNVLAIISRSIFETLKNLPGLLGKRKIIREKRIVAGKEIRKWMEIYKADLRKMIFG